MKSINCYSILLKYSLLTITICLFSCQPEAEFEILTMTAYVNEPIQFSNKSKKADSYKWDFGDGQTSNLENPTHLFTSAETYMVTLEATRNNKTDFYSLDVIVEFDLERYVNTWGEDKIPGISVANFNEDNNTIETHTSGLSYSDVPIQNTMLMGMGSNTKTFTAVLCLKLIEDGKLSLDDPISNYLPEIQNVPPEITIRELLQHKSGLFEYVNNVFDLNMEHRSKNWTYEELLSYVDEPIGTPGEAVSYCNTNYLLLGMIIESITGSSYADALRAIILDPLQLSSTFLEGFEPVTGIMAHPWWNGTDHHNEPRTSHNTASRSAGAITSTPSDMVKWYNELFNKGFLTSESITKMTEFEDEPGYIGDCGLGIFMQQRDGREFWYHTGTAVGYNSIAIYDPNCGNAICAVRNQSLDNQRDQFYDFVWNIAEHLCDE